MFPLLCISTLFIRVLRAPKSWLNYFFQPFSIFLIKINRKRQKLFEEHNIPYKRKQKIIIKEPFHNLRFNIYQKYYTKIDILKRFTFFHFTFIWHYLRT